MTQKTIYKRAKGKFSMSDTSKRIQKRLRKKKIIVTRRKIRSVWKDIVDILIIKPLLDNGKVQIDKGLSLEVVGTSVLNKPRLLEQMKEEKISFPSNNILRRGLVYGIEMTETRFKGKLYFKADGKIRSKLKDVLDNTGKQYRIQ